MSKAQCYVDYFLAEIGTEVHSYEKLSSEILALQSDGMALAEPELVSLYEKSSQAMAVASHIRSLVAKTIQLASLPPHTTTPTANMEKKFAAIELGATVAIRREESPDDEWMLGLVVSFDPARMEYLIEDVSEDEEDDFGRRKRFSVPWKLVQALHETDAAALKEKEYQLGQMVLALFPTTTCLYRAKIVGAPVKRKKSLEYLVQFDNDDIDGIVPTRPVPARFVLDYAPSK